MKNLSKNFKSGFTLIELLVVVAIIGILASVVLASLNTARAKGADAAIKANLDGMRAQAEIVYDPLGAYGTVANAGAACPTTIPASTTLFGNTTIFAAITAALASSGGASYCASSIGAGSAWVVSVELKATPGTYWCVDSTGVSALRALPTSGTACPAA
jgi:prepilin-type N-terminal cleavage/methylation domain-containing protein